MLSIPNLTKNERGAGAMKKKKILKIVLIVVLSVLLITGAVFLIRGITMKNRYSGTVCDSSSVPMEGVAVSNGRDVVLTDSEGKFTLDGWNKARFITVTVPSGYWSEDYYIPVSKEKEGYDFSLGRLDRDLTEHSFIHVTDSEIGEEGAGDWVDQVKALADETKPAFIIHTGDICYEDGLKAHIKDMNTENMGVPVRYVIGNHDYVDWGKYGEALFESIYGPVMYSFEVGNIHYICTPITHGDVTAQYKQSDMARFVDNDLKFVSPDKKVIIFNHTFCENDENGFTLKYGSHEVDLRQHGLLAWVFGHWHYNYLNNIDGIFNITTSRPNCGGIDASPSTIRTIKINGTELKSSELHYYNFPGKTEQDGNLWSVKAGSSFLYSDPLLIDDIIYAGTADDGYPKDCGITAVSAANGKVLWKYKTENSVKSDIISTGENIIAQDIEGQVYCLDKNGHEIWKTELALLGPANTANSIVSDGEHVYCGGQQHIYCLDLKDGSKVWDTETTHGNASPSGFILDGNRLIVGSHWNEIFAFDKLSGEKLWSTNEEELSFIIGTPAMYNGNIIITSGDRIYKIDPSDGKIINVQEHKDYSFNSASAPYIEDGIIYTGTQNKGVCAIDAETFEMLWTFGTGRALTYTCPYSAGDCETVDSPIVPFGDDLCFGASDGYLYIIDKSGTLVKKTFIGAPINQAPAVYGNNIIVTDLEGYITATDASADTQNTDS